MAPPFFEGLFGRLRESKIGNTREALLDSVVAPGFKQLERAQDAEFIGKVRAGLVLSAITAGQREEFDGDAVAARFEREQSAIFVIRVGGDVHEARGGAQLDEHLLDAGAASVHGKGLVRLLAESTSSEQRESGDVEQWTMTAHRLIRA